MRCNTNAQREEPISQRNRRAVNAVHAILMQHFPKVFPKDYDAIQPLKIDTHIDLIRLLPNIDHTLLRRALANHTNRDGYLLALIHGRGDHRYNLDGQPAGTVTPEKRAEALKWLEESTQRGRAPHPRHCRAVNRGLARHHPGKLFS